MSAATPEVSICMPAARNPKLFAEALSSVLEQGVADLEVVVSDDSGGDLAEVVQAAGDPRVRYFANPRRLGFAGNHTAALARARGAYLGILHDDDRLLPGYLSALLPILRERPAVGFAFSDVLLDRGDGELTRRPIPIAPGTYDDFLEHIVDHLGDSFMLPSSTLMRREVWDSSPGEWPDIGVADLTMYIDGARQGWAFHYQGEPLVLYRIHEGQLSANQDQHRDSVVRLWEAYSFEDPRHEALRRRRLAWALIGRAGWLLKTGSPEQVRTDLARARRLEPQILRGKRIALTVLSFASGLAPRAARVWRRLRRR